MSCFICVTLSWNTCRLDIDQHFLFSQKVPSESLNLKKLIKQCQYHPISQNKYSVFYEGKVLTKDGRLCQLILRCF